MLSGNTLLYLKRPIISILYIFLFFSTDVSLDSTLKTFVSAYAQNALAPAEQIVFSANPSSQNGRSMSKSESAKYSVLIKKIGKNYVWATRQDKVLLRSVSGIFDTFIAVDGSGMIVVSDRTIVKSMLAKNDPLIVYGEHIRNGVGVISYEGQGEFFNP